MLDRRGFLVASAAAVTLPGVAARAALPVPGARLGFDILYKNTKLGAHVLTFDRQGDALTVTVAVDIAFKVLGLTVYRYAHRGTERWTGDVLAALQATSDANGTRTSMTAARGADGLVVQGSGVPRYVAPANALPATHWNRRELDGPLIDMLTGKLLRPTVTAGPVVAIPTASKGTIRARRYALTGDPKIDLFYDDRLGWAGLTFSRAGAQVRYARQGL